MNILGVFKDSYFRKGIQVPYRTRYPVHGVNNLFMPVQCVRFVSYRSGDAIMGTKCAADVRLISFEIEVHIRADGRCARRRTALPTHHIRITRTQMPTRRAFNLLQAVFLSPPSLFLPHFLLLFVIFISLHNLWRVLIECRCISCARSFAFSPIYQNKNVQTSACGATMCTITFYSIHWIRSFDVIAMHSTVGEHV